MRTRIFLLFTVFFALITIDKADAVILVLKGESTIFTNTLFSSFLANSEEKVWVHNWKDASEIDTAKQIEGVKKAKPSLILAIGQLPIQEIANAFKRIYVVSVGYYDTASVKDIPNVIAISIEVPPAQAIPLVRELLGGKKRIGVMYNPKLTSYVLNEFKSAVEKSGLTLASIKVDSPEDVFLSIKAFAGAIDLFYFIPDSTVFKTQSLNSVYAFLKENSIPYVTPSSFFLKENGLMSISIDPVSTGRSVYRMAEKIINEAKKKEDISFDRAWFEINYSLKSSKKFGISAQRTLDFFQFLAGKGYKTQVIE